MSYKGGLYEAIKSLQPYASFGVYNNDYATLEWYDDPTVVPIPTKEEAEAELARLIAEYNKVEYQRKRAEEYPDFKEYLDGVVKGDQAQIDKYIADCLAVKAKYPKEAE
jgi:hypothetical protein